MEIWRKVRGHEEYEVSDKGRVRLSGYYTRREVPKGLELEIYVPDIYLKRERAEDGRIYVDIDGPKFVSDIKAEAFAGVAL